MLKDARTAAEIAADDRSVWLERGRFAVWSAGRARLGWAMWGDVGTDDAAEGKQVWLEAARRLRRPYDLVLDLRLLESVSKGAFELIREFAITPKPGLRRHAILVGDAQPGTVQLGLYSLAPPSHEWRAFRDSAQAAAWLGWPDARALLDAAEARLGARLKVPPIIAELRAHLTAEVAGRRSPVVTSAARALGQSLRTLQRELSAAGTSYSAELDRARVNRARALLGEPSSKIEAVAREVGFADGRGLTRLFRRLTGESPAQFRARR